MRLNGMDRQLENIKRSWYKFSRNKMSVVGLFLVVMILIVAVFQDFIAPHPEHVGAFVDFANANRPPSASFWLGTDPYGRDILTRILYSFRNALLMGVGVLLVATPVGVLVGLLAGYYKDSWASTLLMRIVDIFLSLPSLVLALTVASLMDHTLFHSMMALTFSWWAWYARLIYGNVVSIRGENYIQSAELIGAGRGHILFREVLPNCISPVLTKMTLDMGTVILMGATLSFVGLGEQPPKPSLGTMISDGYKLLPDCWWLTVFPALAIMIIVLAFNLLGDGLGDMLGSGEV